MAIKCVISRTVVMGKIFLSRRERPSLSNFFLHLNKPNVQAVFRHQNYCKDTKHLRDRGRYAHILKLNF